jgi:hypothetical protein
LSACSCILNPCNAGTKKKFCDAKPSDRQDRQQTGGDQQGTRPRVFGAWRRDGGRLAGRDETSRTADALNFREGLAEQLVQLARIPERISAAITHLQAEAVELEGIGNLPGIILRQQRVQIAEEGFTGKVAAEQFFLQGTAGPFREDGALQVENALIHIADDGEDGGLHHLVGVAEGARILHGRLQGAAHLGAKAIRILDLLPLKADAQDGGKDFLKAKRETVDAGSAHDDDSTMTVSSKTGCAISPGM